MAGELSGLHGIAGYTCCCGEPRASAMVAAMMRHAGIALVLAAMTSAVIVAQSATPRLAFEVASITRNTTVDGGGGGGFAPGGRFRITNIDVMTLVMIAHRTGPQLFR